MGVIMAEKPTAAFVLSLIAGILALLFGIVIFAAASVVGSMLAGSFGNLGGIVTALGAWWLIAGIIILIGAIMINSGERGKVKTGGILVIVFSILTVQLLVIILGLIGGILALTWKPPARMEEAPPPASEQEASEAVV